MPSILQGGAKPAPMAQPAEQHQPQGEGGGDGMRSTLVSHGDGTHHIEHEDGSQTDHPHIGHALMHMAAKHSEGMHHHTHSDGMDGGHTVHTAAHGEGPGHSEEHGPHDHENLESVKEGLNRFFGEEEQEGPEYDGKTEKKESSKEGKDYE